MNKYIAVGALIMFALIMAFPWMSRPTPKPVSAPTDVTILRDQLSAAWRARTYSDERLSRTQQELYVLQRTFAGCVCQDAGVGR